MSATRIVLIAACDRNGAIGKDNTLPWRHRGDMQHFMSTTTGSTVLMGSKTFVGMGVKCLPRRQNIVLSRTPGAVPRPAVATGLGSQLSELLHHNKLTVVDSPIEALKQCVSDTLYVIGGQQIYQLFLPYADEIQLSQLDLVVEGADTFFPPLDAMNWLCSKSEHFAAGNLVETDVAWNLQTFHRP